MKGGCAVKIILLMLAMFILSGCGAATYFEGGEAVYDLGENLSTQSQPSTVEQSTNGQPAAAVFPAPVLSDKPAWEAATSFVCHYGAFVEAIGLFDIAILEPNNITHAQLNWLAERGTWSIGYISVGEDHSLRMMDAQGPGGYASFYIDDGAGQPARNNNWNSYFVDAGNPLWQQLVIDRARTILSMGFDGIFLDTIDTAEIFPDTQQGMATLIRRLRETFPQAKIVANRGFFMMEDFAPYISGIMFEAFSGGFNFALNEFTVHTGGDLAWTTARANEINQIRQTHYFPVFALDYAAPNDYERIQAFYDRAWAFDFLPSVSVIQLNRVFWRDIRPTTERGIYSNLEKWQN
jgi:hypothetical protein